MQSTKRYQGSCRMPYWYTQTKGPNPLNFHLESPPVTVRNSELEMAWFIWCDIITEQQMSRLRDMHYIAKPHGRAALVSVRVRPSITQCHALKVSLSVCLSVRLSVSLSPYFCRPIKSCFECCRPQPNVDCRGLLRRLIHRRNSLFQSWSLLAVVLTNHAYSWTFYKSTAFYTVSQKSSTPICMVITLSILNAFSNSFTVGNISKFPAKFM